MSWRSKTYDELPALSVRGKTLRRSLRLVTIGWMFGVVWMVCISGVAMLNLGKLAGFNDFHWGLASAIASAAILTQIPASYFIERWGYRKQQFVSIMIVSRLMWIAVGLTAPLLLFWPSQLVITIILLLQLLTWSLNHLAVPAWVTWMSDLIPTRIRGRYMARRTQFTVAVQIVVVVLLGLVMDWSRRPGGTSNDPHVQLRLVHTLVAVFAISGIFGAIDVIVFRYVRDMHRVQTKKPDGFAHSLLEPFSNHRFVPFVTSTAVMVFAIQLGAPFFQLVCREHLQLTDTWTNIVLMATGPLGGILASRTWGRLIDRYGRRFVLLLSTAGATVSVLGWIVITPSNVWLLVAPTMLGGIMWNGLNMAQFNMLMRFSHQTGRSTYVAAFSLIVALSGVLGGLAGGGLASLTHGFRLTIGPFTIIHYHLMFLASSVLRAASMVWLFRLEDFGGQPARQIIRSWALNVYGYTTMLRNLLSGGDSRQAFRETPQPPEESASHAESKKGP